MKHNRKLNTILVGCLVGVVLALSSLGFQYFTYAAVPIKSDNSSFTGTFSSQSVRELWMACFQGGKQATQNAPNPVIAMMCDCVVDKTRKQFDYEFTVTNQGPMMQQVYSRFVNQCRQELFNVPIPVSELKV